MPGDTGIIFASTQNQGTECPPAPERKKGGIYVWAVYGSFDLYVADLKGNTRMQLTNNEYYDAEATVSPKGDKMVFTSDRSGDLELYIMDIDGRHQKQITHELGYDGGAFFSPDGTKLVFRASRPQTEEEKKEYRDLLSHGLVQPTNMEIFVCNIDGSDMKPLRISKTNWAPFFILPGKSIFSPIMQEHEAMNLIYMINLDGLERISHDNY
jgi:Tol biopolymer transport system component